MKELTVTGEQSRPRLPMSWPNSTPKPKRERTWVREREPVDWVLLQQLRVPTSQLPLWGAGAAMAEAARARTKAEEVNFIFKT